ncbi:beta family protein [Bacillus bombysepticus]
MDFKYVPTFRYRSQERKALNSTSISNKILPLIEIVTEKPTQRSKKDSIEQLLTDLKDTNTNVMIDIPMYIRLRNNTIGNVRRYLTPVLADPQTRIDILTDSRLVDSDKVIPVITYNPNDTYIPDYLALQNQQLRKYYNQLAYRIYPNEFSNAMKELANIVTERDIIILDLDETPHTHPANDNLYKSVQQLSSSKKCKSVLLRSAIPRTVSNVSLNHNAIIQEADNSLLTAYSSLGFSAFGDYCGVKKDELTDGGIISPGYIKYSWDDNSYYGFKGIKEQADTFESMVAPSIVSSQVWSSFTKVHKDNCRGCKSIDGIYNKIKKGKSQPEWKGWLLPLYYGGIFIIYPVRISLC